jgi:hypothetical protein
MVTITIGKDGVEYIHTNVSIPRQLRDLAKERGVSISQELREALEKKINKGDAQGNAATRPTKTPCTPSSTRNEVDA